MIKVGLIGCGGRGSGAAANAMNAGDDVRLVAMADVFEDKRPAAAASGLKKAKPDQVAVDDDHCFVGFDAYQKVIDSGVDVVLIACASQFHPAYLKAAVDAGKHVFVEKPHAIDPPGIRVVEAACEEAKKKGLSVVSGLCWRYHTGVQETMKRVLDGAIGDDRRHPGDLHAVALPAHRAPAGPERDGVPVPQLVPLQLALGRRRRRSR